MTARDRFPATHWSAVRGARSPDAAERSRSQQTLVTAYWKPVYKYIRIRWSRPVEDARDLTQEFFLRAIEKGLFDGYDPARGRFRTWLRVCLDGFLSNEEKAARRLKRGGGAVHLPLEFERAEGEITMAPLPAAESIERYFEREWIRSLFELAVAALREELEAHDKTVQYRLFERYDLDPVEPASLSYESLAAEFGLTVSQVTNHLAAARRGFRRLLLERLREITATDEEFRQEARLLLGTDPAT